MIVGWLNALSGGRIKDDETAWCAAFTGAMLAEHDLRLPKNPLSARAYLDLPTVLDRPAVGALAIFWRNSPTAWEGHIGIIAGKTKDGKLAVISGNQNNAVTCVGYDTSRLLGYRWPNIRPHPGRYNLPIVGTNGDSIGGSEA